MKRSFILALSLTVGVMFGACGATAADPAADPILRTKYNAIAPEEISGNIIKMVGKQWMLVTAGTPEKFNSMTAGWGGLGVMWSKPVAFILIRNTRYTYEFLEREPYFTLTFFAEKYRPQLLMFGTKSGRNVDKLKESGFTALNTGKGMAYGEASLIIVCKKIYSDKITGDKAIGPDVKSSKHLQGNDCHRIYFGEIVAVWSRK